MEQAIALSAPAALGLSGASFHEPFHANGPATIHGVTERSARTDLLLGG